MADKFGRVTKTEFSNDASNSHSYWLLSRKRSFDWLFNHQISFNTKSHVMSPAIGREGTPNGALDHGTLVDRPDVPHQGLNWYLWHFTVLN